MRIMKRLMTVMMVLFAMSGMVEAQEVLYKAGATVKGKDVTYRVTTKEGRTSVFVQNTAIPDTTFKAIPRRLRDMPAQYKDIYAQVAMIVRETLTREELEKLMKLKERRLEFAIVVLRVDREKHKLLQVTYFEFLSYDKIHGYSSPDDCFWLTLAPDRLHAIEQAIVEKVEIPEQIQETFLTDDFVVGLVDFELADLEKLKERRKKAVEEWKADPKLDLKITEPSIEQ